MKKGGGKDVPPKEAPHPKCPEHVEPMKIFCFDYIQSPHLSRLSVIDNNGHSYIYTTS